MSDFQAPVYKPWQFNLPKAHLLVMQALKGIYDGTG